MILHPFGPGRGRPLSAALLVLCLSGCERTTEESPAAPLPSAGPSSAPTTVEQTAARASSAPVEPILPDGCHTGIDATGPEDLIRALGDACAPGTEVALAGAADGGALQRDFVVDEPRCYHVIAAARPGTRLTASLTGPDGRGIGQGDLGTHFVLIDRSGPVCIATQGRYRLRIAAEPHATVEYVVRSAPRH